MHSGSGLTILGNIHILIIPERVFHNGFPYLGMIYRTLVLIFFLYPRLGVFKGISINKYHLEYPIRSIIKIQNKCFESYFYIWKYIMKNSFTKLFLCFRLNISNAFSDLKNIFQNIQSKIFVFFILNILKHIFQI